MKTNLVTPPAQEPVTLAQAKAHCRIASDFTDDDTYLGTLIQAAREKVESLTGRALLTQTWDILLDGFPYGGGYYNREVRRLGVGPGWLPGYYVPIDLPRPPLQSIVSITYLDSNWVSQTMNPGDYLASPGSPGRVSPSFSHPWPVTAPTMDCVTIRQVCGYGAATTVPAVVCLAVNQLVSHWYSRREPIVTGTTVAPVPYTVEAALDAVDWGVY
jgi:hypothetical protein